MIRVKVKPTIELGCHKYKLFLNEIVGIDGHDATTAHLLQQIWLDPQTPPSRKAISLIHESLHIICNVYNVGLDEREVDSLSQGLGQLLFSKHNLDIELDWSEIETIEASKC